MDLVLFGIQGSGKGTQAKMLAKEFDFEIFEAGGELRRISMSGSELGNTVKSYIDAGKLVPHRMIMDVIAAFIDDQPRDQKILFDGIPRDENQMRDFDALMEALGREFHCVQITLDPEEGLKRILGRAKIEGRADDASEETIRRRMRTFLEKTTPVIERYRARGKLWEIDGEGSVEEIYGRMLKKAG
ncbi:MAG: nucleoside monophosphate kinase [Patescibacteria group bacterium]